MYEILKENFKQNCFAFTIFIIKFYHVCNFPGESLS